MFRKVLHLAIPYRLSHLSCVSWLVFAACFCWFLVCWLVVLKLSISCWISVSFHVFLYVPSSSPPLAGGRAGGAADEESQQAGFSPELVLVVVTYGFDLHSPLSLPWGDGRAEQQTNQRTDERARRRRNEGGGGSAGWLPEYLFVLVFVIEHGCFVLGLMLEEERGRGLCSFGLWLLSCYFDLILCFVKVHEFRKSHFSFALSLEELLEPCYAWVRCVRK